MNATGCTNNGRFHGSSSRQLSLAALYTVTLLCAPYTYAQRAQTLELQMHQTDADSWTEEDFIDAEPIIPEWNPMAVDEMVQNSYSRSERVPTIITSGRGKGPTIAVKPDYGRFIHQPLDPRREARIRNSNDSSKNYETEAFPQQNTLDSLLQAFTSLLVIMSNMNQQGQQATSRQSSETLASEQDLTRVDTSWPYRTVGRLYFKTPDGQEAFCTAAVLRPRLVSTAGQCVHNGNGEETGWHRDFVFVPAYRNGEAPFGTWTASRIFTRREWFEGNGVLPSNADWALLEITDQDGIRIGDKVGYLGWAVNHLTVDEGWRSTHITALGYPTAFGNNIEYTLNEMAQVNSGVQPFQNSDGTIVPKVYVIGSDWRPGAGGAPWIKNFGWIQDENGNRVINNNWVVSVTSFMFADPNININGGAEFDGRWLDMKTQACGHQAGNCPEGE
jgi:V8-like Glu-specific endopeptidase